LRKSISIFYLIVADQALLYHNEPRWGAESGLYRPWSFL